MTEQIFGMDSAVRLAKIIGLGNMSISAKLVVEMEAKITELEKQLKEGEALVIELVAALKNQQPTEE